MSSLGDILMQRCWWTADVAREASGIVLVVRPGARCTTYWRRTGELFSDALQAREQLSVAVGDLFVVCGPSVDETTMGRAVEVDGKRIGIELSSELASDTRTVQITPYRGRAKSSRKSA